MKKAIWLLLVIGLFWGCKHQTNKVPAKNSQIKTSIKSGQINKAQAGKPEGEKTVKQEGRPGNAQSADQGTPGNPSKSDKNGKVNTNTVSEHYSTAEDIKYKSKLKKFKKDIRKVSFVDFSKDTTAIVYNNKKPIKYLFTSFIRKARSVAQTAHTAPSTKVLSNLRQMLIKSFKKSGITSIKMSGLIFNKNPKGGIDLLKTLFFAEPSIPPDRMPKKFQRIVLKKGKYLKTKCKNVMQWVENKEFIKLLEDLSKLEPGQVLVGPAFCMSNSSKNSFNLMDKELYFYCRVVSSNKLTKADKSNILSRNKTKIKLIPSYIRRARLYPVKIDKGTKKIIKKK